MVDSFKYLPRSITAFYQMSAPEKVSDIPWTPFKKPLSEATVGLITTGGLFQKDVDPPFDVEREKQEPTWGDPSFRVIPSNLKQEDLGASHLHINTQFVLEDINRLLPIDRFKALESEGVIGKLAPSAYSFMGFQGMPHNTTEWVETYGPQVIGQLKAEGVDAVLLTPA